MALPRVHPLHVLGLQQVRHQGRRKTCRRPSYLARREGLHVGATFFVARRRRGAERSKGSSAVCVGRVGRRHTTIRGRHRMQAPSLAARGDSRRRGHRLSFVAHLVQGRDALVCPLLPRKPLCHATPHAAAQRGGRAGLRREPSKRQKVARLPRRRRRSCYAKIIRMCVVTLRGELRRDQGLLLRGGSGGTGHRLRFFFLCFLPSPSHVVDKTRRSSVLSRSSLLILEE